MSVNVYNKDTGELKPLTSAFSTLAIVDVANLPSSPKIVDVIYRVSSDTWAFNAVILSDSDMAQNTANLEEIGFGTSVIGDEYIYTPSTKKIRYLDNSSDTYDVARVVINSVDKTIQIYNTAEDLLLDIIIASGAGYPFYNSNYWAESTIVLSNADMDANTDALATIGFGCSTDNTIYTYIPVGQRVRIGTNEDAYELSKITINKNTGVMTVYDLVESVMMTETLGAATSEDFYTVPAVSYWVGNQPKQTLERLAAYKDVMSGQSSVHSLQDIFNVSHDQVVIGDNSLEFQNNGLNMKLEDGNSNFKQIGSGNTKEANVGYEAVELSHTPSGGSKIVDFKVNRTGVAMNDVVRASFKVVLDINDTQGMIAAVELGDTSANAYAIGDLVIHGDVLYKVTAAIAVGDSFATSGAGANIEATTVEELINGINDDTNDRIDQVVADVTAVENGATSVGSYLAGDIIMRNDVLYKAKTDITTGDSFTVGTNIEAITINQYIKNIISARNARLLQIEEDIATVDDAAAASKNYAVNDLIIRNDILYKVTAAITAGDSFVVGTNISAVTVEDLLKLKQNKLLDTPLAIDSTTANATTVEGALGKLNEKKINISEKGEANGVAELDANGLVPAEQLPSFVDDVIEAYYNRDDGKFYETSYVDYDAVTPAGSENPSEEGWYEEDGAGGYVLTTDITVDPTKTYYEAVDTYEDEITPESGKIYIDIPTNETFRWGGTIYVPIRSDLTLGETSTTAYRGDRGKHAYDLSNENKDRLDQIDVDLAPVDAETATAAHAIGDLIVVNDVLYRVTDDIAIGDTIAASGAGANVEEVDVESLLKLKANIALLADAFDATATYEPKDVVIYEQKLYRFNDDKAAGAWDSTKVDAVTVQDLIANATPDSFTEAQIDALIALLEDD